MRVRLAARAAPAEPEDVSGWQQAPACCWHLGRVLAAFLAGGRAVSALVWSGILDELPECFVSCLPLCRRARTQGMRGGQSSSSPLGCAGAALRVREERPAVREGVGGEALC